MRFSVNTTRITPPHLPNVLERPRLIGLLEKNRDKKLILILGQAAQGKSTLVASYVKQSKIHYAWMNLDKEDSDPTRLFYLIVYSLQYAMMDAPLDDLLSYSPVAIEPASEARLFCEWALSIFERISSPILVVIDGLNRLSPDAPAFGLLQILVENSPPLVHFIMISREIPPLSLEFQTLKMRQEAFILSNEELALTEGEISRFFHEIRKMPLNSEESKKVYAATGGWTGGVILLAESLSRLPEAKREKFVREELPDHFRREAFQYLGKEILSSLPAEVQDFLIKSSILSVIEPAFAKDLLGIKRAEDILREHVRKNLFVQSFYDEKKGWLFRYHPVFRDFLRAKSKERWSEADRHSLLVRGGVLCEQRNEWEDALKFFLEAKDFPRATSIIQLLGMDLIKQGRILDLSKTVLAFPHQVMEEDPWLIFYLSVTSRFTGAGEDLPALQKAFRLFQKKGDLRGQLVSLASLIEASILKGHDLIPLRVLLEQAETLLRTLNPEQYPYERAVLWLQICFGLTIRGGNPRKGYWASQNAYFISKGLGDFSLQVQALVKGVQSLCWLGEFALADEKFKQLEKLPNKLQDPSVRLLYHIACCEFSLFRGDFKRAGELVQLTRNEAERYGLRYLYPVTLLCELMLKPHLQEYQEAEQIGNHLFAFSNSIGNSFTSGLALLYLGRTFYYKGDYEKAKDFLDRSIRFLSEDEVKAECQLHFISILRGFISYHLHEKGNVEENLQKALDHFKNLSSFVAVDAHFALALLKWNQKKNREVIAHLDAGFKMADEKGYDHFLFTCPEDLLRACILALEFEVQSATNRAEHLLTTRLFSLAEPELNRFAQHPNSVIREKAWEMRRKIHRSKVPRLHIETFGEFRVFRGDSLIKDDEWDRAQPKLLLKAIVSYGAKAVPKETIIDQLWPEGKLKSAEDDFKTVLQRLRKSLEPDLNKDFGSSYVHLKDNMVWIDLELCEVDADRFLFLLRKGENKEKAGDIKEALSLYGEAIEVYRGDYLPDDHAIPWTDGRRETLRGDYIELLGRAANLHEKQGAVRKAIDCHRKAIQADPLLEDSYQKLMSLYFNKGMYNEALRAYETLRNLLQKEFQSKPDPQTTAIYKKILEKIHST